MAVLVSDLPHSAFTMLRNCWLRDSRVSYKAKGLLGYLRSHAAGYRVSQAQIVRESADGRDAVVTGLRELEAAGYLTRIPHKGPGRFAEDDYAITDPFDAAGQLIPRDRRETRAAAPTDTRETLQIGLSDTENPGRKIPPIEEQGEETRVPTEPLSLVPPPPDPFDEFWQAYPRKVGKADAQRAWSRAVRKTNPDKILAGLHGYPFDTSRAQFVPHPATWLNGARWEDDPSAVAPVAPSGNGHTPYRDPTTPAAYTGPF